MKSKFLPILAILATITFFVGMYTQDPSSSRTPNVQPEGIQDPIVTPTDAIVKFVDSLNGANDTIALRSRGYIPKRGPAMGPAGVLNNWFQGNPTNWNSFNGPTSGYVSANYNLVSGTNPIDLWLILPAVNTAAGDTLSFYERSVAGNTFPDSTRVYYAANGDTVPGSGSFVELGRFLNSIGGAWVERRYVAPTAGANGRWAINYRVVNGGPSGSNSNLIGIDFIRVLGPAPIPNTTLVMYHDTTVFNQGRKDDRDTLFKYLPGVAGSYDRLPYNNTTVLPSLAGYNNIIIQETANDGATFLLSSAQRSAIIAWLNTGTPSAKKKLLMLGADLGYNYSRVGAPQIDVVFSEQTAGFVFKQDNASVSPFTIMGTTIDIGGTRTMTNTPTGGFGFWPDGNSTNNGSIGLYRHQNHTANDTLAAIGRNTANYTVASAFQDPRYILNGGFGPMLTALWNYLSTPVGITPLNGTIPNVYSLSQNYPNPFNPVTNIKFSIPSTGVVKLVVFDILGRQVATLLNETKTAGSYVVDFDASNLSSGAYFYRLESGDFKETKKMLLVK